jgi:hypothetical protein
MTVGMDPTSEASARFRPDVLEEREIDSARRETFFATDDGGIDQSISRVAVRLRRDHPVRRDR